MKVPEELEEALTTLSETSLPWPERSDALSDLQDMVESESIDVLRSALANLQTALATQVGPLQRSLLSCREWTCILLHSCVCYQQASGDAIG